MSANDRPQASLLPVHVRRASLRFGLSPEPPTTFHTLHLRLDSGGIVHKQHRGVESMMFPDSAALVPAGTPLSWRVGMQFERMLFEFEPLALRRLAAAHQFDIDANPVKLSVPRFDPAVGFARSMVETELANVSALSAAFIDTLFGMLGLHILRHYCAVKSAEPNVADRLRTLCRQHLAESVSVERMAEWLQWRPHQLQRWMKRELDTNPKRFLIELRLSAARQQLLEPGSNMLDIALGTGFASHSHLTSAFKKEFGLTPSEFRDVALGRSSAADNAIDETS